MMAGDPVFPRYGVRLPMADGAGPLRAHAAIDAADLLGLALPSLRWIVPDLLPEGTTVLAAPPKIGKSCLVYQIAVEASLGGTLFGRSVESGAVRYLALEDGERRGQDRLRAALRGREMPRDRLFVQWSAAKIGEGLEEDIESWLDSRPDARLLAIDTLQKVRPRTSGRRNAYELDVEDLGQLQALFKNRPAALLIVHHFRKQATDDFLASVNGTYGLTGSADTIAVIRRKRNDTFGTIEVTGRDVPDASFPVRFEGTTWVEAPESIPEASFERQEVFRAIEANGPIFAAAIAERLSFSRTSVQNMVTKLVEQGVVVRSAKGYVAVAKVTARVIDDSGDSLHAEPMESHQSHRGYEAAVPTALICTSYREHQSRHRLVSNGWVCDLCGNQPGQNESH